MRVNNCLGNEGVGFDDQSGKGGREKPYKSIFVGNMIIP